METNLLKTYHEVESEQASLPAATGACLPGALLRGPVSPGADGLTAAAHPAPTFPNTVTLGLREHGHTTVRREAVN